MQIQLKHLPIGQRIGLALALPIIGLLLISAWTIHSYYRAAQEAKSVRHVAELTPTISALIHQLQIERGLSTGLTGARGEREIDIFSQRLITRQLETDRQRQLLANSVERFREVSTTPALMDRLNARLTAADAQLDKLGATRAAIMARRLSTADTAAYFDATSAVIVSLVTGTATGHGNDTLVGIENIQGSDYNDTLTEVTLRNEVCPSRYITRQL